MANIISYNDVVELLKSIAQRHYQLNTFFLGRDAELQGTEGISYPCLQVYPEASSMPINDHGEYKTLEIKLNCKVVDLLKHDRSNEKDTDSDTLRIAQDIINEFNQHPFYVRSNASLVGDIDLEPLNEYTNDNTGGWEFVIRLRLINNNNFCGLPIEDITGYSAAGPVYTGYTASLQYLTCSNVTECSSLVTLINTMISTGTTSTSLQDGFNTYTGGTATNPTINISGATLDNLTVTGVTTLDSIVGLNNSNHKLDLNSDGSILISTDGGNWTEGQAYIDAGWAEISNYSANGGVGLFTSNKGLQLSDSPYQANLLYCNADFKIRASGTASLFLDAKSATRIQAENILALGIGADGSVSDTLYFKDVTSSPFTSLSVTTPIGAVINSKNALFKQAINNSVIIGGYDLTASTSNTLYSYNIDNLNTTATKNLNAQTITTNDLTAYSSTTLANFTANSATINGDVTIAGSVTVLGTATTLNTQTVQTKDNNITLNLSGTNLSANGGGLTILSGQSNGNPSTFLINSIGDWSANTSVYSNGFVANNGGGYELKFQGGGAANIYQSEVSQNLFVNTNGGSIYLGATDGGSSLTVNTTDIISSLPLTVTNLTSGRVPFITTGGKLTDSSALTYSSNKLSVTRSTIGGSAYFENNSWNLAGDAPLIVSDKQGNNKLGLGYDGTYSCIWSAAGDIYIQATQTNNYGVFVTTNMTVAGKARFGSSATQSSLAAFVDIGANTTTVPQIRLTSGGTLTTTPLAGAIEFDSNKFYGTKTGATRSEFTQNVSGLTSTRIPYADSTGRLVDSSNIQIYNSGTVSQLRILNSASTSQNAIVFSEDINNSNATSGINRYGGAYTSTYYPGSSIAKASSLEIAGGNYNTPIYLGGSAIYQTAGSTSTNYGTRLSAAGLRIDTLSNLHTDASCVLDVNSTGSASAKIANLYKGSLANGAYTFFQVGVGNSANGAASFGFLYNTAGANSSTAWMCVAGDDPSVGTGLFVKKGGNVGVGTNLPSALFHTIGTTEQLRVGYDASNYLSTTVANTGSTVYNIVGTTPTYTWNITGTTVATLGNGNAAGFKTNFVTPLSSSGNLYLGNTSGAVVFASNNGLSSEAASISWTANYFQMKTFFGGTQTATAFVDVTSGTTAQASLRIRQGVAPTTPNDGDIWFDGTNLKMRIAGVTKTFTMT